MGEVKHKIKYTEVSMICDDCGDGHMIYRSRTKGKKPKFIHECDNCGSIGIYDVVYPYIVNKHGERLHIK